MSLNKTHTAQAQILHFNLFCISTFLVLKLHIQCTVKD